MSLLFWDSFDHYATADRLEKYTSVSEVFGGTVAIGAFGRFGTNGMRISPWQGWRCRIRGPVSGSPDVVTAGFAYQMSIVASGSMPCFGFMDGATTQVYLLAQADGSLALYGGGSLLGTTPPGTFKPGGHYYVELQVTIDNVAGAAELRVNEETIINVSGVDTQVSGAAQVTQFQFGGDGSASLVQYFDDFYVLDDAGAQCNDFLGDIHLYLLMPEGAGAHADWTPLVGANWQEVDDNPPDGDTTYNATNTVTDRDSFEMEDMPGGWSGTIQAVGVAINSRRDDAVAHELEPSVRSGGTDYDGAAELITDSYSFYNLYAWELDPDTAAAWLVAGVNAMECGYELTV